MRGSYYVLDRFEGRIAVLVSDGGEKLDIEKGSLPNTAHVGSCFRRTEGKFIEDNAEEEARQRRIEAKMSALFID